jgi:hypothetical protein
VVEAANLACKILVAQAPLAPPPLEGLCGELQPLILGDRSRLGRRRGIEGIDYEAHRQMAEHQLKQITIRQPGNLG